jgi:hypothetical protein
MKNRKCSYDVLLRRIRNFSFLYVQLIRTDVLFQGLKHKNLLLFYPLFTAARPVSESVTDRVINIRTSFVKTECTNNGTNGSRFSAKWNNSVFIS